MNETTIDLYETLAKPLGLTRSEGAWFFGKARGFPVGLQAIPGAENLLLLFQIRHALTEEAAKGRQVEFDREVRELIEAKKVEIEFDARVVWVSIVDAAGLVRRGAVPGLLMQILDAFAAAGLREQADLCHACRNRPGESVVLLEEKVAAVCANCEVSPQPAAAAGEANPSVRGNQELLPLVLGMLLGAAVSAIGWAICWGIIYWAERIPIVLASFGIAVVCGTPVGWLIRRIHGRSRLLMLMAAIGTTLGIVLGEVLYITWFIYSEAQVIDPITAAKLLPDFQAELEGIGVVMKLACVVIANAIAMGMVGPEKGKGAAA